jgi:hypothetical protein
MASEAEDEMRIAALDVHDIGEKFSSTEPTRSNELLLLFCTDAYN